MGFSESQVKRVQALGFFRGGYDRFRRFEINHDFRSAEFVAEDRFVIPGQSHRGKVLIVVPTERRNDIRIISARNANRNERATYEQNL